jgi:hypothetical protein|tara:strand:- start:11 stop:541 length:531 start_codon:yes stop_codon:yes gene_type:complete
MTSILKVDNLQNASGNGTPYITGAVLQVVPMIKTDAFNDDSTSFIDITGFTCSITPSSTSSKILIMSTINGSQGVGANRTVLKLLRNNSDIMLSATGQGNRELATCGLNSTHADLIATSHVSILDSPSTTSQVTYKWQGRVTAGSGDFYINRSQNDTNDGTYTRFASNIILMEIGG